MIIYRIKATSNHKRPETIIVIEEEDAINPEKIIKDLRGIRPDALHIDKAVSKLLFNQNFMAKLQGYMFIAGTIPKCTLATNNKEYLVNMHDALMHEFTFIKIK